MRYGHYVAVEDDDAFLSVNRLLPDEERARCDLSPEATVTEALEQMRLLGRSHAPVLEQGRLQGTFSHRALASHFARVPTARVEKLAVEDIVEELPVVRLTDSLHELIPKLLRSEAVVVGDSRDGVVALVTQPSAATFV